MSPLVTWIWIGGLIVVGGGADRAVARGRRAAQGAGPAAAPRVGASSGARSRARGSLLVLVLLAVVLRRGLPLRGPAQAEAGGATGSRRLEAAKEAKYREIRDAELDFRTGKLSEADWRAQRRTLRAEAVELLRELDRAKGTEGYGAGSRYTRGRLGTSMLWRRKATTTRAASRAPTPRAAVAALAGAALVALTVRKGRKARVLGVRVPREFTPSGFDAKKVARRIEHLAERVEKTSDDVTHGQRPGPARQPAADRAPAAGRTAREEHH